VGGHTAHLDAKEAAMAFRTVEDVDGWVAAKGPGGAEQLRELLATNRMTGTRAIIARAWIERYDRSAAGHAQTAAQDLALRQTIATEVATSTARESLAWAKIAVGISILAVLVAAAALYGDL
jgi:hypothetical protein